MAKAVSFSVPYLRIEWRVKNVLSVCGQESEEFRFQTSLWRLALEKFTFAGAELIRVLLQEARGGNGIVDDFASRVFTVDENRTPHHSWEQVCRGTKQDVWWTNVKDLRQNEDIFSPNDTVSFVCIFTTKTTSEDGEMKPVQAPTNANAEGSVQSHLLDFRRLLEDGALSDVILKCGDRTIPAHRLILSARSEVFAAMLRSDMTESRSGVIEVSDVDPPILEQLLQFIYSCKWPDMSMGATPQLYEAADKYGVESLREVCSAFMSENLTEGSACSILHLADAHGDCDLKDRVISFIVKTKLFKKDDAWLKFCEDHPKLANEVLNRVCKTLS